MLVIWDPSEAKYQSMAKIAEGVVVDYTLFKKSLLTPGEVLLLINNACTQPILSLFYKTETHSTWRYCTYVMQDGAPAHRAKHTREEEKELGIIRLDFDWGHGS